MKITVFSSNQPRHINLIRELAEIADELFFISEVTTVFPGMVDDFVKKTDIMQRYFENVIRSEKTVFGNLRFLPENIRTLVIRKGDLNRLDQTQLGESLSANVYVVFGASYIKGWLIDFLVEREALNIHMGIAPFYRGSSCNFWALYDDNPSYVGSTIQMLSKGLDSGDIVFHCLPNFVDGDSPFDFTMRSVLAAHRGLCHAIENSKIFSMDRIVQDRGKALRYTRHSDFTDEVANEFLDRRYSINKCSLKSYPELINPFFY